MGFTVSSSEQPTLLFLIIIWQNNSLLFCLYIFHGNLYITSRNETPQLVGIKKEGDRDELLLTLLNTEVVQGRNGLSP
jgi:hypothetical protein